MRRTEFFCQTLREAPADSDLPGNALLMRGSYIQQLASGIYSFLPLGRRVLDKIERILREEMNAVGGQEITMPVVQPAELWQETGRWQGLGEEMVRFRDRADRDMLLAMTHEEVVADLVRKHIRSYRQIPVVLYQIQTKFRDEPRPRGGLLRVREFMMKDAYSLHPTPADLDRFYPEMYRAYFRVFRRCGIDVVAVLSDVGMMGGSAAHEFMFISEVGEDQIAICEACGYSANRQVATFRREVAVDSPPAPLERVATPEANTIVSLARLLGIPESQTAKATFFTAAKRLIFAVVRGDMSVNETKLANVVGATDLRPARTEELQGTGIVPGYASPIGVKKATVVVDDLVARSPNLVAGANEEGWHLRNTNIPRDYKPDLVADIASVEEGFACATCTAPLRLVRGVEVGNIFKLGTRYTDALAATYLDESGTARSVVMGSYGIGVGRLMACIAEGCRDDKGPTWPVSVAPFEVYLVGLDLTDETVARAAEKFYSELASAGLDILFDDRSERAGVKFNDADLLGIPLRATVSRRTVAENGVELRLRSNSESLMLPAPEATAWIRRELERLSGELDLQAERVEDL
jgi:prolyl-tRNA synthetase